MRVLMRRIAGLFGRDRRDRALDDEARFYLEMLAAQHVVRALGPADDWQS